MFLTRTHVFDVMANFLMPWQIFWRYDARFDVMTSLSWVDKINMDMTKDIYTHIPEWWCGQTLCWVGITCVQKHTHNHYLIRPILKLFWPSYKIKFRCMILCAKTLCRPHQGCLRMWWKHTHLLIRIVPPPPPYKYTYKCQNNSIACCDVIASQHALLILLRGNQNDLVRQ